MFVIEDLRQRNSLEFQHLNPNNLCYKTTNHRNRIYLIWYTHRFIITLEPKSD